MQQFFAGAARLGPCHGPVDAAVSARIDVLRIVAIGLIVICHGGRFLGTQVPYAGPGVEWALTMINRGLACLAVPLFFCISGFLLLRKLELTPSSYVGLLRKKLVSIGLPFLLFNGIWIVWLLTVGSIDLFGSRSYLLAAGIVPKLLGLGSTPLNYPLWFLRDLLTMFALAPVFLLLLLRLPRVGLLGLLVLWFAVSPVDEYGLCGFACCFYLGGFLARSRMDLGRTAGWDGWVLPAFAMATALVGLGPWLGLDVTTYAALKKGYQLLGVAALWCLSRQSWLVGSRLLHRLATYSFFIFLTHEPTVSLILSRLLAVWQPTGSAAQLVAYFVPGFTALAGLSVLAWATARYLPRVFALVTGAPLRLTRSAAGGKAAKPLAMAGS